MLAQRPGPVPVPRQLPAHTPYFVGRAAEHLSPSTARMFRLLGLHPGPDIALAAAAHLMETPPHRAREALGELTMAYLLTQQIPGQYAFHDVLRAYATHLTTTQDPPKTNTPP